MLTTFHVLAYFSPETMLPLSSIIATIAGFALLIKRSSIRFVVHCFRAAFRRRPSEARVNVPHFAPESRETTQTTRS
jgi:hypothetical protein